MSTHGEQYPTKAVVPGSGSRLKAGNHRNRIPTAPAERFPEPHGNHTGTTRYCTTCGAPVVSLVSLAEEARLALRSLDGRRLALPDRVRAGLVVIAAALPCHAGTCIRAPEPALEASNQPPTESKSA